MKPHPWSLIDAEHLAKKILKDGQVAWSRHALDEMEEDNLSAVDVTNVIRGGWCEGVDFENDSWRYRIRTQKIVAVVAFRSEAEMVVVTAWRAT